MGYIGQAPANKVVTSADIEDGVVSAADLGANSVDSSELVDGSVDNSHMSVNSIDSDQYVDLSIDTAHIGATQVTGAKLNTDVISAQTALAVEPADTDEFMVSDGGVLKRIDYSLIKGGGITEADQWRLTTDFTNASNGANEIITANWERNDTHFDKIGTGLTESSGVFSFASTGVYMIQAQTYITLSSATSSAHMTILTTPDNSTYTGRAFTQVGADANRGDACMCQCFIDVTNTTNDKFKIQTNGGTYITWNGHSSQNETTVTAIRLGDT